MLNGVGVSVDVSGHVGGDVNLKFPILINKFLEVFYIWR